jgi:hypothetical protein
MLMFTFCDTILLVSMRTGDTVLDAKCGEVSVEALVLSTPVALDGKGFLVEKSFDMVWNSKKIQ